MTAHNVTIEDAEVRGHRGTKWKCSCGGGGGGAWAVRDGSAESDAHQHLYASDPEYRARQDERYEAWKQEQRDKGCKCELLNGFAYARKPECVLHRPKNMYKQPLTSQSHHEHRCSCHQSAPCGQCENCRHWDHPDCENDRQTCEEHEEES